MDRFDQLRVFLAIVDQGSLAGAARALRRSPAAITRALAELERQLGVGLIVRTTRALRLTEQGELYAERARRIVSELDDLDGAVRGRTAEPRGLLCLTAPTLLGELHVLPIVERLVSAYPGLSVRLVTIDRPANLVEEGFDAAVRIGHLDDSALVGFRLGATRSVIVASPSYLAEKGEPHTPADLRRHRIVMFEGVGATDDWAFGGGKRVTVRPALSLSSAAAAIASAIRGHGVTRALSYQVGEAIAAGRLTRILQPFEPPPLPIHLLHPPGRFADARLAAFKQAARDHFAADPQFRE